MTTPSRLYDVIIIETILHRAQIAAHDLAHINELARQLWDDDGEAFDQQSLGRADLIIADEVRS